MCTYVKKIKENAINVEQSNRITNKTSSYEYVKSTDVFFAKAAIFAAFTNCLAPWCIIVQNFPARRPMEHWPSQDEICEKILGCWVSMTWSVTGIMNHDLGGESRSTIERNNQLPWPDRVPIVDLAPTGLTRAMKNGFGFWRWKWTGWPQRDARDRDDDSTGN